MAGPTFEVVGVSAKAYVRQPMNLVLLVIVPPLFIIAMSSAISTFSDVIGGNLGERAGTGLAGLWAAALLTGAATFFVLRTSLRADARLVVAGLSRRALVAAQSVSAMSLALVTATVSFAMLLGTQDVADPLSLFGAIFLSALIYAAIGVSLAWFVEGDLEGSFVIILIFMLDAFVGGPLGGGEGVIANLFPVHFPSEIAVAAMLGTDYSVVWFAWGIAYLAVLASIPPLIRRIKG